MQSSSWLTSNSPNFPSNTSSFWSNAGYRKRKSAETDFEEKSQYKIFLTEEKLVQNMQTLAIDLSVHNNNNTLLSPKSQDNDNEEENQTQVELHQLLKDNLRKDDLQDHFINKLCDLERKKFSMQIVPYMPIHPAQLTHKNHNDKEAEDQTKISSSTPVNQIKQENDDHLFKKPLLPTLYTVEEPPENTTKRPARMKRSYSQSLRSNSNLSVVELRNDTPTFHSSTDYFIFEPTTPSVLDSSTTSIHSSLPCNQPSIRITEYFDFSSPNLSDHFDMQSMFVSDAYEKMDDDNI